MFGNKNKKEQIGVIQTQLQSEDNIFHRTIIALERLERFLNSERGMSGSELKLTAVGTDRDFHDDVKNIPTRDSYFMELALQCNTLYMAAHYDDSEVFKIAVESFMKDLLEWYAGRYLLEYYDEVDASVIPIMVAITYESNKVSEIFQKYVYTIPSVERTQEEKYIMVKEGVEAWLLGRHYADVSANNPPIQTGNESYVTPHVRGTALDGYKRIVAALTTSFDTSAPVKMFYKMVNKYLPYITKQVSDINEESIDELYERKAQRFMTEKECLIPKIEKEAESHMDIEQLYPVLYEKVKDILDAHNIKYSEINIEVK